MDRSSRLDSDPESESHDQGLKVADIITPFVIVQESMKFGIPSIKIDSLGVAFNDDSPREILSLGSGLTSQIIQHTTGEDTKDIVPPGSIVALKVFNSHGKDGAPFSREDRRKVYKAVLSEIRMFCQPSLHQHPNIAKLLFIGYQKGGGPPLLAMELGKHGSLDFIIREANPAATQKRHIMLDIALGLRAIYRAGFIHGDLKPENIVVTAHHDPCRQLVAKLIDFGGSIQSDKLGHSPAHITPLWSAPEVVNEDPDIDWEKADVYSYGLVVASLWAKQDGSSRFGEDRSSSCVLSRMAKCFPEGLKEHILFSVKSSPTGCISLVTALLISNRTTETDKSQLVDILTPMLERYFWRRPNTEDLIHSLISFGRDTNRNIEQEDASYESKESPPHIRSISPVVESILEQSSFVLEDFERSFSSSNAGFDIDIPMNQSHEEFIECLIVAFQDLLTSEAFDLHINQDDLAANEIFKLWSWTTATHYINSSDPDGFRWMRASALCGSVKAMQLTTLMPTNTAAQDNFPIRLCLSVLALSHSEPALQRLSVDWPDYYKMVREIIQEKPLAYEMTREQKGDMFLAFLPAMLHYMTPSNPVPEINLQRALEIGDVKKIAEILAGNIITQDLDRILPDLLHELSHLVDSETPDLAVAAFNRGAKLDSLVPCVSPILGLDPLGGLSSGRPGNVLGSRPICYSPLSSAISRGKTQLALAIFWLHLDSEIPIPDFPTVLSLSFRYLQDELGMWLLRLLQENASMCCDSERPWGIKEAPIQELLTLTMHRNDLTELERRAMHGNKFDSQYEACLQILLEEGANPNFGLGESCPLLKALKRDDLTAIKLFVRRLQSSGTIALDRLADPGNTKKEGQLGALKICIHDNSIHCFEFLLDEFPDLIQREVNLAGVTPLHTACLVQSNPDFVHLLLNSGAQITTMSEYSPLHLALVNGHLQVADLIASRYPDDLTSLVSQDYEDNSMFFVIFVVWMRTRSPKAADGLRWLIKHGGTQFYGQGGFPLWMDIVRNPRPSSERDQAYQAEIVDSLLGSGMFRDKLNDPFGGLTLLHLAAMNGHAKVIEKLLNQPIIDVNVKVGVGNGLQLTPLDFALSSNVDSKSYPESIRTGGNIEIEKWRKDINSIIGLLRKHGGHGSENVEGFLLDVASFEHEYGPAVKQAFSNRLGQSHGDWPRPISSSSTHDSNDWPSLAALIYSHLEEDGFPKSIPTARGTHSRCSPACKSSLEATIDPGEHEKAMGHAGVLLREMWRLPPDWELLNVSGIVNKIWFKNLVTGEIIEKKPPLYYSEDDETSSRDRKGRSKETATNTKEAYLDNPNGRLYQDFIIHPRADLGIGTVSNDAITTIRHAFIRDDLETCKGEDMRLKDHAPLLELAIDEEMIYCSAVNGKLQNSGLRNMTALLDAVEDFDLIDPENIYSFMQAAAGDMFHAAIISNNLEGLAGLVDSMKGMNLDIDRKGWGGLTPLQFAVSLGQIDMVNVLAAHGADVGRVLPRIGLSPLHFSIKNKNLAMVELLLGAGADPNGATREGLLPLHLCLESGDKPEVIRTLIEKGARIDEIAQGVTPLQMATSLGRENSVKILQDPSADVSIGDTKGKGKASSLNPVEIALISTNLVRRSSEAGPSRLPRTQEDEDDIYN